MQNIKQILSKEIFLLNEKLKRDKRVLEREETIPRIQGWIKRAVSMQAGMASGWKWGQSNQEPINKKKDDMKNSINVRISQDCRGKYRETPEALLKIVISCQNMRAMIDTWISVNKRQWDAEL